MSGQKPTFGEKVAYKVDNLMSLNPFFKLFGLIAVSAVIVLVGGVAYALVTNKGQDFLEGFWAAWLFLADTGTQAEETKTLTRTVGLVITIGGMLVFALLLGIVTESLGQKLEDLKKGKSRVIETNHTLILGWEEKIFSLITEIIEANANLKRGVIVVLADMDKETMEDEIHHQVDDFRSTLVVCRSGSQTDVVDLHKVNAQKARAIVVLGDARDPEESDVRTIKTVLALQRGIGNLSGHITAEIMEPDNRPMVEMVGQGNVEAVMPREIVGRIMVQTARQNGLAQTYVHLLGFEGSEFYLEAYSELDGKQLKECWPLFPDAVICGLKPAKGRDGPPVWLNPPDSYRMEPGDKLLILAEDDDTFSIKSPPAGWQPSAAPMASSAQLTPEHYLFLGWRRDVGVMVRELDEYVTEGSTLTMVSTLPADQFGVRLKAEGVVDLKKLKLHYVQGNVAARRDLERLQVHQYSSIIVLADETAKRTPDETDAHTLMSLLLIRDIQAKHGVEDKPLLSEIRDPRTKELAKVAEASDYVVSNEIVSMLISQIAESRQMNPVWADLFQSEGSEIYLKDATRYARPNEMVTFYDLMARARSINEIALGYALATELARDPVRGIVLNPADKNAPLDLGPGDRVIVLSEDDV